MARSLLLQDIVIAKYNNLKVLPINVVMTISWADTLNKCCASSVIPILETGSSFRL